jgi:hypothetical protein
MDKRRLPPIKEINYIYVEPKNEEERQRLRGLDRFYDELFNSIVEERPINEENI